MLIVDSQVHIWAPDTPQRPWPKSPPIEPHPGPLSAAELRRAMVEAGVHRAILVPPSWEGTRNDLALTAAAEEPDRFAVMGRLAIEAPEAYAQLRNWLTQPGMLGLRMNFRAEPQRSWLRDGTADWLFRCPGTARHSADGLRDQLIANHRQDRRPASRLAAYHRPHGHGHGEERRSSLRRATRIAGFGEPPKCRGEGNRRSMFRGRTLSLSLPSSAYSRRVRCFWTTASILGHGSHTIAVHLPPGGDVVHRGTALAHRE